MLGLILLLVFKVCSSIDVNGNWGSWGSWNWCTKTCVGGTRTRYRSCNNPTPANGGSTCPGLGSHTESCSTSILCTVNGNWGSWGSWNWCTKTCVGGTRTRYRSCNNPTPVNGGFQCPGLGSKTESCSTTILCTVNGNWGLWGDWTQCTMTFVGGTRTRNRACDNPSPVYGGFPCQGLDSETGSCSTTISCPVNGNWGTWLDWNSCSATCGNGSRSRYQECNNPEPANGGSDCQGNDTEIDSCSIKLCQESEDENSSATIGIGASIGSTALVVGLLIVFIYILKRYRIRKSAESAIYDTTGDTGSSNLDLHIYDGIQHNTESPTHRQNGVIYENMII